MILTQILSTATNVSEDTLTVMRPALIILAVILAALVLSSIIFTVYTVKARKASTTSGKVILTAMYIATIIALVCTFYSYNQFKGAQAALLHSGEDTSEDVPDPDVPPENEDPEDPTDDPPPVIVKPDPTLSPAYTSNSDPANWGIKWEIITGGAVVESYTRPESISFGNAKDYTALEGITTFRGDNYRSGATYGTANVVSEALATKWSRNIGSLNGWTGSGWTGQPLVVRWDAETKAIMNLYADKKLKENLVEVILATLDGYIYFYDLEDGTYTRDPIFAGMNFKGAGTLDPRGYPLMYVGSGDYYNGSAPRMFVISLIDGKVLYQKSGSDSFSKRKDWAAFDSAPLVDAETDTLIWPGESGILYTIKLNSVYDQAAGTISVAPEEIVKTRYTTSRSNGGTYWLGYEPSAVIVDRYLYISENGGMFFCIDLDSMQLVWAQDTKDDSNSTPVFQWDEDGNGYIYTAPSLHWTANSSKTGSISIYKINANTGEIVWEKPFNVHTVSGVSGGVQSSPLLGKEGTDLEGLILYTVARTPNAHNGVLVAVDTETGETVWEFKMDNYTWSSPTAVYTESGKAYVVVCDSVGVVRLLNATTGTMITSVSLGSNIEASPVIFEDTIVVGTRGQKVVGIQVS